MFKPAKIQYSCTTIQYEFNLEDAPKILEQAKKLGFKSIEGPIKTEKERICHEGDYLLKRHIEATFKHVGDGYDLEYHAVREGAKDPDSYDKALDCLRLNFIAADRAAGTIMSWIEPANDLDSGLDFSLELPDKEFTYRPWWLFAGITNKCNLDCSFCYNKKGEQDLRTEDFKIALYQFKESLKSRSRKDAGVTFGGGEPTLHPELESLVQKAKEEAEYVTLSTNGTNTERILALADHLDGVAVSAPFIYNSELSKLFSQDRQKIQKSISELRKKIKNVCVATIVTDGMKPEDVYKVDSFAENAGATNTLFLLHKPNRMHELMPTKEHARKILEAILELAYRKKNAAIDACYATYTTGRGCYDYHYIKPEGRLLQAEEACPFTGNKNCLIKYIYV